MTDTSRPAVEALAARIVWTWTRETREAASATLRALLAERDALAVEKRNHLSIMARDAAALASRPEPRE